MCIRDSHSTVRPRCRRSCLLRSRPVESDDETRRVQELLAWLLEFHRREAKPVWWRMFDRHGMTDQELVDDADCIGGLRRTDRSRGQVKKSWEYEYRFDPDQDTK